MDKQDLIFLFDFFGFKYTNEYIDLIVSLYDQNSLYTPHIIRSKKGKTRIIHKPNENLNMFLKYLSKYFSNYESTHKSAFGFVKNKSIVENASMHINKSYVFNIDIKNFFYSINSQLIAKALVSPPFNYPNKLVDNLLNLVCINDDNLKVLPLGAPTSPVLSNIACFELDVSIENLVKHFNINYSRYADDFSFSCDKNLFYRKKDFRVKLRNVIIQYGLEINHLKTRLYKKNQRQKVTGIVVNKKLNLDSQYRKEVTFWVYMIKKFGYENANLYFQKKYTEKVSLIYFLKGKLDYWSMVVGKEGLTKELKAEFKNISTILPKEQANCIYYNNLKNKLKNIIEKKSYIPKDNFPQKFSAVYLQVVQNVFNLSINASLNPHNKKSIEDIFNDINASILVVDNYEKLIKTSLFQRINNISFFKDSNINLSFDLIKKLNIISNNLKNIDNFYFFKLNEDSLSDFVNFFSNSNVYIFFKKDNSYRFQRKSESNNELEYVSLYVLLLETFLDAIDLLGNFKVISSGDSIYFDLFKSLSLKFNLNIFNIRNSVNRIKHSPYVTIAHTKNNKRLEELKYNPAENKPASASSLNKRFVIKTNERESDFKEVFKENEMLLDDPEVFNQGLEIKVEIVDNLNIPQTLNDVSSSQHTFTASQVATIKKIINDIVINNTNSVALESLEELDKILTEGVYVKDVLEQLRDLESILYADSVLKLNLPEELKLKYSNVNFSQAIRPIVTAQNALKNENLSSDELFAITAGLIEGIKMKADVDKYKKEFPNQSVRIRLSSEPLWYWDRRGTSEGGFRSSVAGMTTPHQNRTKKLDNTTSVYIPTEFILNTIIENNQPSNGNNNIVEIKDAFKNSTREFKENDESTFINIGGIPFFAFQDNLGKKIYIPSIFHYRANANKNNPNAVKNKLIDYIINTNLALLNTSDKKVEMELLEQLQDLIQNVNFKSKSNNIGTYFLMPNKAKGAGREVRFINSTSVSLGNDLDTFNDKNRLLDILEDRALINNEKLVDIALSRFNHFLSFTKSDSLDNVQKIKATEAFLNSNRDTNAFITYVKTVFNTRTTDTVLNYKTSDNQDKSVELDIYTQMLTNVFSALDRYPLPSNSPGMFFHNPASFILDPNSIGFNIKEEQTKLDEEKFLKEKQESLKKIEDKQNAELEEKVKQNINFRETNQPKTAEDFNAFVNNLFETIDVLKLSDSFKRALDKDNIEGFLSDNFYVYFAAEYLKNQSDEFIGSFYENLNENLGDLILDNIDKLRSDANLFKRLEDYHYILNPNSIGFNIKEEQTKLKEEKFLKEKQESLKKIEDKQNAELEESVKQNINFRETNQPKTAEDFNTFVNNLFETIDVLKLSDSFKRALDKDNIEGFLKDNFNVYFAAEYLRKKEEEIGGREIRKYTKFQKLELISVINQSIDALNNSESLSKTLEKYHYTTDLNIRRFDI
jgi:DNA-binding transcriptional MerR regulator